MAVIPDFETFRRTFAEVARYAAIGTDQIEFVAPDILRRSSGDWTAGGFKVAHRLTVSGTGTANDRYFTAATVGTNDMTVVESVVVAAGPFASVVLVEGAFIDNDGRELWPVANVRAGGIGDITNIPIPYAGNVFEATINDGEADVIDGADEYDWYLSQRTDILASQYWSIIQGPGNLNFTFSGSVRLVHTVLAETEFGIVTAQDPTPQQLINLTKHVDLYVQRRADKAISWVNLQRHMTTAV